MGKKKSIQAAMKAPTKLEKKQQNHSLMKILRPKVFITDSSNFKTLVQELTGNGNSNGSSPASSPPQGMSSAASPPPTAFYDICSSFDDSSLEGSPDLRPLDSPELGFDFLKQIMDLEALLMGIDNMNYFDAYDSCSAAMMIQQEVCAYDYDFSSFI